MPDRHPAKSAALIGHGAARLPAVEVDTYNAELRCPEGFLGDRASRGAFLAILEDWRESLRELGDDPLGDAPTEEIGKKKLDKDQVPVDQFRAECREALGEAVAEAGLAAATPVLRVLLRQILAGR